MTTPIRKKQLTKFASGSKEPTESLADVAKILLTIVYPRVGGAVAGGVQVFQNFRQRKVLNLLTEMVSKHSISIDQIQESLIDEKRGELIAAGVESALKAHDDAKIKLLATIVAEGIKGNGIYIDNAFTVLNVANNLEPVHIKVLKVIQQKTVLDNTTGEGNTPGYTSGTLRGMKQFSSISDLMHPIIGVLEGQRLIMNIGPGRFGGIGDTESWGISEFGNWFLNQLKNYHENK